MGLEEMSGSEKGVSRMLCIVYEKGKGEYNNILIQHDLKPRADRLTATVMHAGAAKSRNNATIMLD